MPTNKKVCPARQRQTDHRKIQSRVIIPHENNFRPVCLWGFIGKVDDFKRALNAQKIFLNAGVIAP